MMSETAWDSTALEAAARDLVDVGLWEVAGQEERTRIAGEKAIRATDTDLLEAAEADLRRARRLYCLVLEQSQLIQHLLRHSRAAFEQARERREQLEQREQLAISNSIR